ncbi:MAG: DNA gyrase inhibitor YacG [Steroidobacteraceae bacterium]
MSAPRVRCPTCHRELAWNENFPWRPFCSERCKMVDLGAWFAEERAIGGESADTLKDDDAD